MKNNILSFTLFFLFILQIFAHNTPKNDTKNDYKTFLVKTQLSKEELLALLQQEETEKVNLKKNKNNTEENKIKSSAKVQEINITAQNNDTLQQQIETEIKEDALHPLDEFHLRQNASEVKTFIAKPQKYYLLDDGIYVSGMDNVNLEEFRYLSKDYKCIIMLNFDAESKYDDIIFDEGKEIRGKLPDEQFII